MAPRPIDTKPDQGQVFTQQEGGPSVSSQMLSPSVAGAAYESMGKLGEQLSTIGENALKPEMADRGTQAVTRDPGTGELTVQMRTPLNDLDVAYNHAAQATFLTKSEGDRRASLQQMAIDNIDDPATFQELATKYVKTQAGGSGVPAGLRGDILNTGLQDISQFTQGLVTKKQARDTKNQFNTINAGIKDTSNDVFALAHQGGTGTPDFAAAVGKLQNQLNTLGGNPLFGMSPAEIEEKKSQILSSAEGEATLGAALNTAKAMNSSDAGLAFLQKSIWDPKLNLTPTQRETFEHRGTAEIHEWDAGNRAANVQLKQTVIHQVDDAISMARVKGKQDILSNDQIDTAFKDDPARAQDIHNAINGAATTFSMGKQVALATPKGLADLEAKYNPANQKGPGGGYDAFYKDFLAPHEGGYKAADGNGQPVNFGVNQGANPDLDVKNLTPDEAKKVLHDRYWTASGADALPPQLAAVVGDTAVNMGVGRAKDLLSKSGGDANKYLDMRAQAYKDIAAANPEKAANLPDWLKRNEDLRGYIGGVSSAGGFADRERTYQAFLQARHQRNEELGRDPAAYTASVRPDIQVNLQSNDPNQVAVGVRASIQAQRDFGVNAPKVLSVGQAQAIVQQFDNPGDPTKRADHMNQTIDGLAQRYGGYFPQVMSELQAKGMPPEAASLYAVRGMGVPAVRMATAINSMSKMGKDLNEGRDKFFAGAPNNSEIRKAIPGVMADYAGTLQASADGPQQTEAMTNAVSLYVRQLAYEGVNDPGRAAQQAHDDLIGSRYNFVDSYRVPKGIDQSIISLGANAVKGSLGQVSADAMNPQDNFAKNQAFVKPGANNFTTALQPQQEAQFRSWVQKNKVAFDPNAKTPDYDMRGFWLGLQTGDPHATTGVNKNDGKLHFTDYWKTPYHKSFSNESQWANPATAPHWTNDDKLVTPTGQTVFDERAPAKASINLEPYASAAPGVSVDDRRAMSAKILSQQGRWVTRADDKGLTLVWPQSSGYMPALDAKGKPISYSWAALQSAGQRKGGAPTDAFSIAVESGAGGN